MRLVFFVPFNSFDIKLILLLLGSFHLKAKLHFAHYVPTTSKLKGILYNEVLISQMKILRQQQVSNCFGYKCQYSGRARKTNIFPSEGEMPIISSIQTLSQMPTQSPKIDCSTVTLPQSYQLECSGHMTQVGPNSLNCGRELNQILETEGLQGHVNSTADVGIVQLSARDQGEAEVRNM